MAVRRKCLTCSSTEIKKGDDFCSIFCLRAYKTNRDFSVMVKVNHFQFLASDKGVTFLSFGETIND